MNRSVCLVLLLLLVAAAGCTTVNDSLHPTAAATTGGPTEALDSISGSSKPTPARCTQPPREYELAPAFPRVFGSRPLWGVGLSSDGHLAADRRGTKVLWLADSRWNSRITVTVANQAGRLAPIAVDSQPPSTTVSLDPRSRVVQERIGRTDPRYVEFRSLIYLKPGCWAIAATWPGGGWSISVSVP